MTRPHAKMVDLETNKDATNKEEQESSPEPPPQQENAPQDPGPEEGMRRFLPARYENVLARARENLKREREAAITSFFEQITGHIANESNPKLLFDDCLRAKDKLGILLTLHPDFKMWFDDAKGNGWRFKKWYSKKDVKSAHTLHITLRPQKVGALVQ